MTVVVGPRTRAALQAVGYRVVRSLDKQQFIAYQPFKATRFWTATDENVAWQACLDHLKANAEALCSRMMAAIAAKTAGNLEIQPGGGGKSYAAVIRPGRTSIGDGPTIHGAALALFLRVCCDPEDG